MINLGTKVYYVDFNGKVGRGVLDCIDLEYSWIKINKIMNIKVETERIGVNENEAYEKFETWKIKYKNYLAKDNNWLKELLKSWNYNGECAPKELIKIMQDVLKNELGVNIAINT